MRIWISPAAILVFAVLVQTEHSAALREVVAAEVQEQENSWTRITFPGPRHKEDPAFPARQGSDRSEYMWFFEVSPQNPSFMIMSHNMGAHSSRATAADSSLLTYRCTVQRTTLPSLRTMAIRPTSYKGKSGKSLAPIRIPASGARGTQAEHGRKSTACRKARMPVGGHGASRCW